MDDLRYSELSHVAMFSTSEVATGWAPLNLQGVLAHSVTLRGLIHSLPTQKMAIIIVAKPAVFVRFWNVWSTVIWSWVRILERLSFKEGWIRQPDIEMLQLERASNCCSIQLELRDSRGHRLLLAPSWFRAWRSGHMMLNGACVGPTIGLARYPMCCPYKRRGPWHERPGSHSPRLPSVPGAWIEPRHQLWMVETASSLGEVSTGAIWYNHVGTPIGYEQALISH